MKARLSRHTGLTVECPRGGCLLASKVVCRWWHARGAAHRLSQHPSTSPSLLAAMDLLASLQQEMLCIRLHCVSFIKFFSVRTETLLYCRRQVPSARESLATWQA